MNSVGILLVLYNDSDNIPRLIKSINNQTFKSLCIYAVETSESGDSSNLLKVLYPGAKILPFMGNLGFAAGNNILAKEAVKDGHDFLFVLNPDMELSDNTIEIFIQYFNYWDNLGAISSTLLIGNTNKIQLFGVRANFNTQKKVSLFANEDINEIELPEELVVDYINGGSTFLSTEVYKNAGLFNEDYFMYNDEIDLAYRIRNAGFITVVTSKTKIRHHHNWVKGSKAYYWMYYYIMRNKFLFYYDNRKFSFMVLEIGRQLLLFPITIEWLIRTSGKKLVKYYYLGLLDGVRNKRGKAEVNFF